MSVTKMISCLPGKLIINSLVLLAYCGIASSQNLQVSDSVNDRNTFSAKTIENKIIHQDPSHNFYSTDSIFSLSSPKGYIPSLFINFGRQAVAPFHFKTKEWIISGAAFGITVALIHFDSDIDDWAKVQKQKHNWVNKSSPVITEFGGNLGICSVVAAGLLSAAFKNQKGVQTSLMATQAMITSGLWVHVIKLFSGRERPMADYNISKSEGGKWHGPFAQFDQDLAIKRPGSSFDSFPSGHAATAFSIATVFATQYSDIKAIPIISYSVASLGRYQD